VCVTAANGDCYNVVIARKYFSRGI